MSRFFWAIGLCLIASRALPSALTPPTVSAEPTSTNTSNAELLGEPITLSAAARKTLAYHPSLQTFAAQRLALDGQAHTAALTPDIDLNASLDNVLGSDAFAGANAAELTLGLSSTIELGQQRPARTGLVAAERQLQHAQAAVQQQALLGQLAVDFITLAAEQARWQLQRQSQRQWQQLVSHLTQRVASGALAEAELLSTQATALEMALTLTQTEAALRQAQVTLANYWPNATPTVPLANTDLSRLPAALSANHLRGALLQSPSMKAARAGVDVQAAKLTVAESAGDWQLAWGLGIKHFSASQDQALVFDISVPLGQQARTSGVRKTAQAQWQLAQLDSQMQWQATAVQLERLVQQFNQARAEALQQKAQLLPLREQALQLIQQGYRQGRYGYADLALAQREQRTAAQAHIDTLARAHQTYAQIEQLLGGQPAPLNPELQP